jgi:RES domain
VDASPIIFRNLPHHRFSHPENPFAMLYLAATIPTCLWEVFGDDLFHEGRAISAARWEGCALSEIEVPLLRCCAVSLAPTREVMSVDKATLMAADLGHPQAWALAIQQHPIAFEALQYTSRFLDQPCLAVFDRGSIRESLEFRTLGLLNDLDAAVEWLDQRSAALV